MNWKFISKKRTENWLVIHVTLASIMFFSSGFEMNDRLKISTERTESDTQPTLDSTNSGQFTVLTYNIAGLPQIISSAKTKRAPSIAEIGKRINAFDLVNVQEDFNYNKNLYNFGNKHPFRTISKGRVPFGDGLNTLSRYPLHEIRRIRWKNCTGADCLTPKGFTYSRLEIARDVFLDLYNVHTNANDHLAAAAARRENIKQLSDYIKTNSKDHAVIVMGDLNAHYSYYYDNLHQLLEDNKLKDAWLILKNNDCFPQSVKGLPDCNILRLSGQSESIDKILFRGNDHIQLDISKYNLEDTLFQDDHGTPLSDHHPVSLMFSWKLRDVKPGKLLVTSR